MADNTEEETYMTRGNGAMAEAVTLELPDEVVRRAREAAQRTGRRIEEVLAEWISRGAASDDTTLLLPGAEHPIYTPYGNETAAQGLLDALHEAEASRTSDGEQ